MKWPPFFKSRDTFPNCQPRSACEDEGEDADADACSAEFLPGPAAKAESVQARGKRARRSCGHEQEFGIPKLNSLMRI